MGTSVKKRIGLTKNVINKKGVTPDKKARYERKLQVLEGMLKQEINESIKYTFKKGGKQLNESGYIISKK